MDRTAGKVDRVGYAPPVSIGDWRIPLLTGLAIAVVTAVPYVYGYLAQPHGHVFMGFFYLGDDANTYLAKMRQGWEGSWSWDNRYTTETSPAAYSSL